MNIQEFRSGFISQTTGRIIEGYAFKWDQESNLINESFIEVIRKGAVTQQEIDNYDIVATFQHSEDRGILARSRKEGKSTLLLKVDSTGLFFRFTAPNTQLGNDVLEMVKNGDISNTSFAFTVDSSGENWVKKGGKHYREITKFSGLYDISLVVRPAYQQNEPTVSARNRTTDTEITEYYKNLEKIINKINK